MFATFFDDCVSGPCWKKWNRINKNWTAEVVCYWFQHGEQVMTGCLLCLQWWAFQSQWVASLVRLPRWAWSPACCKLHILAQVIPVILLERFYLKSLFKCEQWMVIVCKCARGFLAFKRRVWISDSYSFQGSWLKVEQYVRAYLLYLLATFLVRLPRLNFEI